MLMWLVGLVAIVVCSGAVSLAVGRHRTAHAADSLRARSRSACAVRSTLVLDLERRAARRVVLESFEAIGARAVGPARLEQACAARRGNGCWSYGEVLTAWFADADGGGTEVVLESCPALHRTGVDWGRNRANVRRVREQIARRTGSVVAAA